MTNGEIVQMLVFSGGFLLVMTLVMLLAIKEHRHRLMGHAMHETFGDWIHYQLGYDYWAYVKCSCGKEWWQMGSLRNDAERGVE